VAERALLDTGFLVALVNAADPDHGRCVEVWSDLRARLFTVEGVLVEAAHLLRRAKGGPSAAVHLVLASGAMIVPATEPRLQRALALMQKYADVPMDLVDAQLVAVAEEHQIPDVLTLALRGFRTYRLRGRERFRLRP
jgi:uncharacterized protein